MSTVPADARFATSFPEWVTQQVGAGYVLVAKHMLDFDYSMPTDLGGAHEHVEWFHNFWWVNTEDTKTRVIAFFDHKEEAIRAGEKLDANLWWAVYDSAGIIHDGRY